MNQNVCHICNIMLKKIPTRLNICSVCSNIMCKKHGIFTFNPTIAKPVAYCLNCVTLCAECADVFYYLKEDIQQCSICHQWLCATDHWYQHDCSNKKNY